MRSRKPFGLRLLCRLLVLVVTSCIPVSCLSLSSCSTDGTAVRSHRLTIPQSSSSNNNGISGNNNRREILTQLLTSTTALIIAPSAIITSINPSPAIATTDELYLARPMGQNKSSTASAPLEYLLPATRVGLYIYQCCSLAEDLVSTTSTRDKAGVTRAMEELNRLLVSTPPPFIQQQDPVTVRKDPYNLPPILGEVAESWVKTKERKENNVQVGSAQFFEIGELIGERRAWNRLVRAENNREGSSEIRRALNIYTTNILYNQNQYQFSGTAEEKKKLIRDERLPDTVVVIRSDLDARDLYRNAVQTSMEDVVAEFLYQKKILSDSDFDPSELLALLTTAKTNIDKWFSFIPDADVRRAIETVKAESGSAV